MPNTTVFEKKVIGITFGGTTTNTEAWSVLADLGVIAPSGLRVLSMQFFPVDTNSEITVTDGVGGDVVFRAKVTSEYDMPEKIFPSTDGKGKKIDIAVAIGAATTNSILRVLLA